MEPQFTSLSVVCMSSYNQCVPSRLHGLENTTYKEEEVMGTGVLVVLNISCVT